MVELVLPKNTRFEAEMLEKRSRFITLLTRVSTAEEARAAINGEKDRFPDARHWCSAYIVSVRAASPLLHSSDDGEPSGTAGRPMLDTLLGSGLTDVVAVVTRYFGGTLLGTGGLVRAYSDSVSLALEQTRGKILERRHVPLWNVLLPHAQGGRYISELNNAGYTFTPNYLAEGVSISIPTANGEKLQSELAAMSQGTLIATPAGEDVIEVPVKKQN
ncbi:YigZ family protein [Actinotignum urinale]|uniref:YigZ family protein n=1 Tax=Actinotignum urinale TaxID=190146 RepID=A0AAW9HNU2_9ACTO|nr:YigZ family protein [Actinotignum urinale]MDY5133809.1 YigZ family protein [Actinotignum urinale]MDY5152365.1 YigZ family protein [Actinotignum urinale]MDY5155585.1 YigZ family protein [Actinotignum urinale]MDY5160693.1 YigZ family protein [Actinotignum urinale]